MTYNSGDAVALIVDGVDKTKTPGVMTFGPVPRRMTDREVRMFQASNALMRDRVWGGLCRMLDPFYVRGPK